MSETPNVVVHDPRVRRVMNWVIGVAAILFPAAMVLDGAAPGLDWSGWTVPGMAVTSFLAGVWGIAVSAPNVPRSGGKYAAE